MVKLASFNPLNITRRSSVSRGSRQTLPRYERVRPRATSSAAEKYGQPATSFDESDEYSSDSPVTSSSRGPSGLNSLKKPILRRKPSVDQGRPVSYRLSQRITRYLCIAMITTIALFIFTLVRMSHVSARKLAEGNVGDRPPAPPAPWTAFPFLKRYYGGIRTLVPRASNQPEYPLSEDELSTYNGTAPAVIQAAIRDLPASKPFNPYPDYTSQAYLDTYEPIAECYLDAQSTVRVPMLQAYEGRPRGFPDNVMGSAEVLGINDEVCFERYGRLGPYGHGYSLRMGGLGTGQYGDMEGKAAVWATTPEVDFRLVDWADAQRRCHRANERRFKSSSDYSVSKIDSTAIANEPGFELVKKQSEDVSGAAERAPEKPAIDPSKPATSKTKLPRTAVVVRTWDEYHYREEDILYLRSLISELSLGSGGEYEVHLLVQVKDTSLPIWADPGVYEKHLHDTVPEEFWGIATLWSETQMLLVYQGIHDIWARGPDLPVHGVYRGLQMAIQNFAHNHPEYDYFWHWEMDVRYTGHFYHLLDRFTGFAKDQPRKGLWERNARFYVPSVHGSWEDFKQMVRVQTEIGTDSPGNMWAPTKPQSDASDPLKPSRPKTDKPIWGPERPADEADWFETENDPKPPTSYEKDKYTWGVGEEADLITLNPIFDPDGTTWGLAHDIAGYNTTLGLPPRRSAIVTAGRMSKRLLTAMHRETAFKKHHAFSEMWPATAALHHGYKAVYVPHPMYVDREWPTQYLASVMNAGRNGASGGSRTSVFGEREHNLLGVTWYYNAGFAPNLWRRWLGFKVDNEGGEEFETEGVVGSWAEGDGKKGGEGRMCLPPLLVHPIKGIELPVEEVKQEETPMQTDPNA
jgi:hypothetical protein